MKAAVVTPGQAGSVRLADVPKPQPKPGEGLVRVYEGGIDGTDAASLEGQYGEGPPGVGVLLEPLTIAEKALDQIQRIQSRLVWEPERAVILGAGPVGLLAALLLRLQDLEVHVYDRTKPGLKSELAEAMGAQYIWAEKRRLDHKLADEIGPIDIIFEATGYSPLAFDAMDTVAPNGIVCLSGVSGGGRTIQVSADHLNLELVLGNRVVFGTVNATRRHFESGARHLNEIEACWPGLLPRIITARLPIEQFAEGVLRGPNDVKKVVEVAPITVSGAIDGDERT